MRAMLLRGNPDIVAALQGACSATGIELTVVDTVEALLTAADLAQARDFLIIDCSLKRASDEAQCRRVLQESFLDVRIIHDTKADVQRLAKGTPASAHWLPTDITVLNLFATLRNLVSEAHRGHRQVKDRLLSSKQQQVAQLLVSGHSLSQIARIHKVHGGTVKRQVGRMREKLHVSTTRELRTLLRALASEKDQEAAP